MNSYVFGTTLATSFDDAIARVTAALAAEGFGIVSDIDVAGILKKKLDLDRPPYRILGACSPTYASRAIAADPQIGALLPCNVVVREDAGVVHVEFMDPAALTGLASNAAVRALMPEVRAHLERVRAALG